MGESSRSESRKHKKKDKKENKSKSSKHNNKKDKKESKHSHSKKHKHDKEKDKKREKERERYHEDFEKDNKYQRNVVPISEDDYFLKNEEFRVWLRVSKSTNFESLTTIEARELFADSFCKAWNKGKLAAMYYEGTIPAELRHECAKTGHKWGFKLSNSEKEQVSDLGVIFMISSLLA